MQATSRLLTLILFLLGLESTWAQLSKSETDTLKLQIFLDKNNFGPGYLDGRAGTYTKLAIKNYNLSKGRDESDVRYLEEAQKEVSEALITSVIPSSAAQFIDKTTPTTSRYLQSKRKFMHYSNYAEYLAERYHTSVAFLKKINSSSTINNLGPRSILQVPNVEPFLIENLSTGRAYREKEDLKNRFMIIDTAINQLKVYEKVFPAAAAAPEGAPVDQAEGDSSENEADADVLAVSNSEQPGVTPAPSEKMSDEQIFASLEESNLVASFPITTGKPEFIRRGYWKVQTAIELPIWRYDESLLKTGVVSKSSLIIPEGPNNPVGIAWFGLNRRGIGIHGTCSPETIGRSQSAGCIRLSNWNASKMPSLVRPGCKVWLK
jgi:lipoprotein-anchoring transpeptidase ErfK/SrfK